MRPATRTLVAIIGVWVSISVVSGEQFAIDFSHPYIEYCMTLIVLCRGLHVYSVQVQALLFSKPSDL